MDVLIILVFVSLVLVTAAVVMFIMRVQGGDLEHGDRLSLLPLDEDRTVRREPKRGDDADPASGGEQ